MQDLNLKIKLPKTIPESLQSFLIIMNCIGLVFFLQMKTIIDDLINDVFFIFFDFFIFILDYQCEAGSNSFYCRKLLLFKRKYFLPFKPDIIALLK